MDEEQTHIEHVPFELIPSRGKEQGWQNYLEVKGRFIAEPKPTSDTLKDIHRVLTSHYQFGEIPEPVRDEMTLDLYTLDRPDGQEKFESITPRVDKYMADSEGKGDIAEFFAIVRQYLKEACEEDTEVRLAPEFSGELRAFGTRKIGDGEWELVYASHSCNYATFGEQMAMAAGAYPYPPTCYYGISVGLDEVYESLCSKFDEIMSQSTDLEGKLLAESFLQIVGTRVLHPFWDANGRAFGAHVALTLEKEGIEVRDYAQVARITRLLTEPNEQFLKAILKDSSLQLVSRDLHHLIKLNADARADYMGRLRGAIENAISHGVSEDGPYFKHIAEGARELKRYLINNGLVEPNEQERRVLEEKEGLLGEWRAASLELGRLCDNVPGEEEIEDLKYACQDLDPEDIRGSIRRTNECIEIRKAEARRKARWGFLKYANPVNWVSWLWAT